jgi:hypothetical protein
MAPWEVTRVAVERRRVRRDLREVGDMVVVGWWRLGDVVLGPVRQEVYVL